MTDKKTAIKKILSQVLPLNIISIGLNYTKQANESGIRYPEILVMFLKNTNTIIEHGDPIV